MGFFYKHFVHPFISGILGLKAYSKDFYLVRCIEADEADLIPDELFRIGMAYYKGESMLPQGVSRNLVGIPCPSIHKSRHFGSVENQWGL